MNKNEMIKLVNQIILYVDQGESAKELLEVFQEQVDFPNVRALFNVDYSAEYIVGRVMLYENIKIGDISRRDLIEIVKTIISCKGKEYEIDNLVDKLSNAVGDPNAIDYIYFSDIEMTAEEIVDKALSNKAIKL